jgi:hypothetical protein
VKVWGASLILEGALREAARSARSRSNEKPARSSGKKQPAAASEARR